MQRQIGAIALIAGTCIGSGMIALPLILAKLALIPSIILMLLVWALMYFSALISIELHIKAKGLPIGQLGSYFNSKISRIIGTISLKLLHFALVSVYIYACSSVIQKISGTSLAVNKIAVITAISAFVTLLLPMKFLDFFNRILGILFLSVFGLLLAILLYKIDFGNLPLVNESYNNISSFPAIIPILFTSFGFQGSMHTIVNYCNLDSKTLRKAVFIGTLIPTLVYIMWTICALGSLHSHNPEFYAEIIQGNVEVGDLIAELAHLSSSKFTRLIVYWISLLAIITSLIGVGRGLADSISAEFKGVAENVRNFLGSALAIIPSLIIALLVPNAFITILGFAGMILTIIAIMLPAYLFRNLKASDIHYKILNNKSVICICASFGALIILCELSTMIG